MIRGRVWRRRVQTGGLVTIRAVPSVIAVQLLLYCVAYAFISFDAETRRVPQGPAIDA